MRGKTIRPYTDQEQKTFIQNLDYEPLKQKKLEKKREESKRTKRNMPIMFDDSHFFLH